MERGTFVPIQEGPRRYGSARHQMSQQFVKKVFRVIALRGAISSCFLNEQLAGSVAVGVPQLEDDGVDGAIIPILSIICQWRCRCR